MNSDFQKAKAKLMLEPKEQRIGSVLRLIASWVESGRRETPESYNDFALFSALSSVANIIAECHDVLHGVTGAEVMAQLKRDIESIFASVERRRQD